MKKTFLILKIFLLLALFAAAGANVYAADYYWVGRDINDPLDWDRIANWSNVSGGSGGRTSPPVSIDDVHFDANSFTATRKTVNLTTNSYCRNIVFANVPAGTVFNFGTQTFEVSGSFTLAAGMITSGTGIIRFVSANAAENLTANQVVIYPNVEIRGTAQWTIDAPFRTDTTGTTTRGTFTYANPNSLTVPGDMRVANITWSGGGGLTVNGNLTARYDISANPYFGGGTSHSGAGDIKVTGNFTTYTLTFSTGKTAQDSIIVGGTLTTYNTNFNGGGSLITNAWVATSTTTFSGGGDITVGTVWTNNGYVNFTGNGNITVGTSFTGASTFYANGNGNITIGQAGNTGEVFKITGNQTSNSPYYYNSVRMLGTGTKTFNGDVNAYYSTSFQGGTVNIKGSLNVQTGVTSASYCSEIYHSLINGGCLFTVDGDVTARNVTTPATQTLGSRFVVTDAGTAVNVGGSFTQGYLHILDGVTNIQGKLTLRGYSTACADMYSSLLITGGELNFNIAGVQNVDIMG
ncbi:MAG: hypothetical protein LBN23_07470, partial [Paludibacter sp.]|nr:hypothetical protein [Paludibacter sp.]